MYRKEDPRKILAPQLKVKKLFWYWDEGNLEGPPLPLCTLSGEVLANP